MNISNHADVVSVLTQAAVHLIVEKCGIPAVVGKPAVVDRVKGAPCLLISIARKGSASGPVILSFDPELARNLTERMFHIRSDAPLELSGYIDAVGEICNILVGSAFDELFGADPFVSLAVPHGDFETSCLPLDDGTVQVAIGTEAGQVRILVGTNPGNLNAYWVNLPYRH